MKHIPFLFAALLWLTIPIRSLAQDAQTAIPESPPAETSIQKTKTKKSKKEDLVTAEVQRNRFFAGVDAGNIEEVKRWYTPLSHLTHNEAGETALTRAILNDDEAMVAFLTEKAVINLRNKSGETPLTLAIKRGNPFIIQKVLERAKADLPNHADETPVMLALDKGDLMLLQTLIDRGAWVHRTSQGITPIYKAIATNQLPAAAILLRAGADPRQANENGETPLLMAVRNKRSDLAELLLNKSKDPAADANWKNPLGEPLLHLAIRQEDAATIQTLLKHGAYANAGDYLENTGLHLSIEKGNPEIAQLLIAVGADPNRPNLIGLTPVQVAEKQGHPGILGALRSSSGAILVGNHPGAKMKTQSRL